MYRITEDCVTCGSCKPVCPVGAIVEDDPYVITSKCTDCGKCAEVCPVEAIVPGSKTPQRKSTRS
ncbi:MAG TPA: 4Fe-4S binding protein [Candidatus Ozemobacteraceae bacterium]|nr:4Fe-4S binding protein [Candidatus Ozemobacteraceae bacterium]